MLNNKCWHRYQRYVCFAVRFSCSHVVSTPIVVRSTPLDPPSIYHRSSIVCNPRYSINFRDEFPRSDQIPFAKQSTRIRSTRSESKARIERGYAGRKNALEPMNSVPIMRQKALSNVIITMIHFISRKRWTKWPYNEWYEWNDELGERSSKQTLIRNEQKTNKMKPMLNQIETKEREQKS